MPEPETAGPFESADPFLEHAALSVREADEQHAVVEQSADPTLANHAGIRHAGALFTVGYAASRALVAAALAESTGAVRVKMIDSEIDYTKAVSTQRVEAVAKPDAGWESSLGQATSEGAILPTEVTLRDEEGNTVATMKVLWQADPLAAGGN